MVAAETECKSCCPCAKRVSPCERPKLAQRLMVQFSEVAFLQEEQTHVFTMDTNLYEPATIDRTGESKIFPSWNQTYKTLQMDEETALALTRKAMGAFVEGYKLVNEHRDSKPTFYVVDFSL